MDPSDMAANGDKHMDAEWKRIQKKTFTRWCNEHLKVQSVHIEELTTDLSDGVRLILLIEVLSQKKVGRYSKKPRVHAQRMENAEVALNFITRKERIRLVNIGAGDIVAGNLKLILGLIWTLILHYQISIGFNLGDNKGKDGPTPKQALMNYIQEQLPDVKVNNLTTAWNDGRLIAQLVDNMAPGLCPEAASMEPQNALENATHAMKLAEDWLGVPMVLLPEDMVNPSLDELSMMTYLSQFPEAKLKDGAPIQARDASKVKVFGPGVEKEGLDTNTPEAEFTVDPRPVGRGTVTVSVMSPEGQIESTVEKQKNGTYKCSYVPTVEGEYVVYVNFNGKPAGASPYKVNVAAGCDALACHAYGPGVEGTDLRARTPTEFWVETEGAGQGKLGITVRGPKGPIAPDDLTVEKESDSKYHVSYTPQTAGPYTVEVTFSGLHIQDSPFRVRVGADRADASKCRAEGPGVDGTDVEIKKQTWFDVYTKGAGRGDLSVHIKAPHGNVPTQQTEVERGVTHFTYTPMESGEHVITVKYAGDQIPGSRFRVPVEPPTDPSKCVATGPGLSPQGVRVNEPTKFNVKTKGAGHGELGVKITGPDGEVPYEVETAPYSYNYTYTASEPGDYKVDIKFADQHIPGSVFPVAITDPSKAKITGPGMNGECLPVDGPLVYQIDARDAGPGEVKCTVQDAGALQQMVGEEQTDSASAPIVTANGDGTFQIEYTPRNPGLQKMNVTFGEAPIPETPVRLNVFDPSKVKAYGPGLDDGNKSGVMTHFTVDMRKAGEGQLHVGMGGPVNTTVTIKDQANNMVKCEYTPAVPGEYVIDVQYEGTHIQDSPFHVNVRPSTDASAVRAYGPGLESGLTTDMWAEFFVDYSKAGDGEPQVVVNGPGGGEDVEEEQVEDGLRKYRYYIDPDEAGDYKIDVNFADEPIPDSPFTVHVNWKTDPSRVKAYGQGLEGGIVGDWTEFQLDMTKAGEGSLNLQIEGPCEAQVEVEDHDDGTATVRYLPVEPGEYKIHIQFAEQNIPGSPFGPVFEPATDASKVKAYGPGLEHDGIKVGDPGDFTIDTREAGAGAVDVVIDGPYWKGVSPSPFSPSPSPTGRPTRSPSASLPRRARGVSAKPQITSNNDDTYGVTYNPRKVGVYKINVFFADSTTPDSPYEVNITDPNKVKVTGPGAKETGATEGSEPEIVSITQPLEWGVDCNEAGPGKLEATLWGPDGNTKDVEVVQTEEDTYCVKHEPEKAGRYRLKLTYSGNEVKQSPIEVALADASKVRVTGSGLAGGKIGDTLVIDVDSSEAGDGGLALALGGPAETQIDCDDHGDGTATLTFEPKAGGEYKLDVKFAEEDVPGSVFTIPVIDPTKAIAYGSGVTGEGARVGQPAEVIVDARDAGPAPVEAKVTDPSGETTTVELLPGEEEGLYSGSYDPKEPGYYGLEVKFAGEDVQESPFQVPICDPDAVQLAGPGLESGVKDIGNIIDVFTDKAGPGEVAVELRSLEDESAPPVESYITQVDDNHYQINYTPHAAGDMEAQVTYGGFPVGDKLSIPICDPSKVKVEGPGVESGILACQETEFTVDATEAGPGELGIEVVTPDGEKLETTIAEIEPRKWQVKYTPKKAGNHTVDVKYGTQDVKDSPFFVEVCDPQAVKAYGPGLERAIAQEEAPFTVDASKAGEGSLGLEISGPADCEISVEELENGIYKAKYVAPRPGIYHVQLKFADKDIPGSPFEVLCERPPPDASKCIVAGVENPGSFTVDCKDAGGNGMLEVGVCGAYVPVEFVSVKHNGDYTFSVSYDIPEPGETIISVKWHDQHLTGSPFTVITK